MMFSAYLEKRLRYPAIFASFGSDGLQQRSGVMFAWMTRQGLHSSREGCMAWCSSPENGGQ
jgi:hypothetical protein